MVENPKGPYQKHQNDGDEHDEEQMEDDEMEDGNDEEVFPESEGRYLLNNSIIIWKGSE